MADGGSDGAALIQGLVSKVQNLGVTNSEKCYNIGSRLFIWQGSITKNLL